MEVDGSQLWLDELYVRLTTPRNEEIGSNMIRVAGISTGAVGEVWMTGVTLQGNGDGERDSGMHMGTKGAMYAEGAALVIPKVHNNMHRRPSIINNSIHCVQTAPSQTLKGVAWLQSKELPRCHL